MASSTNNVASSPMLNNPLDVHSQFNSRDRNAKAGSNHGSHSTSSSTTSTTGTKDYASRLEKKLTESVSRGAGLGDAVSYSDDNGTASSNVNFVQADARLRELQRQLDELKLLFSSQLRDIQTILSDQNSKNSNFDQRLESLSKQIEDTRDLPPVQIPPEHILGNPNDTMENGPSSPPPQIDIGNESQMQEADEPSETEQRLTSLQTQINALREELIEMVRSLSLGTQGELQTLKTLIETLNAEISWIKSRMESFHSETNAQAEESFQKLEIQLKTKTAHLQNAIARANNLAISVPAPNRSVRPRLRTGIDSQRPVLHPVFNSQYTPPPDLQGNSQEPTLAIPAPPLPVDQQPALPAPPLTVDQQMQDPNTPVVEGGEDAPTTEKKTFVPVGDKDIRVETPNSLLQRWNAGEFHSEIPEGYTVVTGLQVASSKRKQEMERLGTALGFLTLASIGDPDTGYKYAAIDSNGGFIVTNSSRFSQKKDSNSPKDNLRTTAKSLKRVFDYV